eukprot:6212721-Pleurochrysis_carterae.AAC.2
MEIKEDERWRWTGKGAGDTMGEKKAEGEKGSGRWRGKEDGKGEGVGRRRGKAGGRKPHREQSCKRVATSERASEARRGGEGEGTLAHTGRPKLSVRGRKPRCGKASTLKSSASVSKTTTLSRWSPSSTAINETTNLCGTLAKTIDSCRTVFQRPV